MLNQTVYFVHSIFTVFVLIVLHLKLLQVLSTSSSTHRLGLVGRQHTWLTPMTFRPSNERRGLDHAAVPADIQHA
eukprot:7167754-Pyramimonas_sp.AAC.1